MKQKLLLLTIFFGAIGFSAYGQSPCDDGKWMPAIFDGMTIDMDNPIVEDAWDLSAPQSIKSRTVGTPTNIPAGQWRALFDDDYIYILVEVTDDTPVVTDDWDGDAVEVYFDQNAPIQYGFGYQDRGDTGGTSTSYGATSVEHRMWNTEDGYIVKAKFNRALMRDQDTDKVYMEVAVNQTNAGGRAGQVATWTTADNLFNNTGGYSTVALIPALTCRSISISNAEVFGDGYAIGAAATLTFVGGGFATDTYQWYANGTPIPGETGMQLQIQPQELGTTIEYSVINTSRGGLDASIKVTSFSYCDPSSPLFSISRTCTSPKIDAVDDEPQWEMMNWVEVNANNTGLNARQDCGRFGDSPTCGGAPALGSMLTDGPAGKWRTMYTEDSIYFFVQVFDDEPNNERPEGLYWVNDAVEIYLGKSPNDEGQSQFGYGYVAGSSSGNPVNAKTYGGGANKGTSKILFHAPSYVGAGDGYWMLEVAIPLAEGNNIDPENLFVELAINQSYGTCDCRTAQVFTWAPYNFSAANADENYGSLHGVPVSDCSSSYASDDEVCQEEPVTIASAFRAPDYDYHLWEASVDNGATYQPLPVSLVTDESGTYYVVDEVNGQPVQAGTSIVELRAAPTAMPKMLYRAVLLNGTDIEAASKITTCPAPVTVKEKPEFNFEDIEVCEPTAIDLTANKLTLASGDITGLSFTYYDSLYVELADETKVGEGTYHIFGENANGCVDTATVVVTVNDKPEFSFENPAEVCEPTIVDLTASKLTLSGGDITGLSFTYYNSSYVALPDETKVGEGTYRIIGRTDEGCLDTATVVVTVNDKPEFSFENPAEVCEPTIVDLTASKLTLSGGDITGLSFTYYNSSYVALPDETKVGKGTYYIIGKTEEGCADTATVIVTVNDKSEFSFDNPEAVCLPYTVDLTASALTLADGNISGLSFTYYNSSYVALPDETKVGKGTYYIIGKTDEGCADTATVIVTVNDKPEFSFENPTEVCEPALIDLTASTLTLAGGDITGLTFTYYDDAYVALTDETKVGAGTYYIIGKTLEGCKDTATVVVTVNDKPEFSFDNPVPVCSPATVDLTATGLTIIDGDILGLTFKYYHHNYSGEVGDVTAVNAGIYHIVGTSSVGCADTTTVEVVIKPHPIVDEPLITGLEDNGNACIGKNITFETASGKENYQWNWPADATLVSGGGAADNTLTVMWPVGTASGSKTITVSYEENGCPAVNPAETHVSVVDCDDLNISLTVPNICLGSSGLFEITVTNGSIHSPAADVEVIILLPDNYTNYASTDPDFVYDELNNVLIWSVGDLALDGGFKKLQMTAIAAVAGLSGETTAYISNVNTTTYTQLEACDKSYCAEDNALVKEKSTINVSDVLCTEGTLTLPVSEIDGIEGTWTLVDEGTPPLAELNGTTLIGTGNGAGNIQLIYTDEATGCVSDNIPVAVVDNPTVTINVPSGVVCPNVGTISISATPSGGNVTPPGYGYAWTGATGPHADAMVTIPAEPLLCEAGTTVEVSLTIVDDNRCSATDIKTIAVGDDVRPAFDFVPADVIVSCENIPSRMASSVEVSDNCTAAGDIVVQVEEDVITNQAPDCPNSYTIIRTWTATDACGNIATAIQKITVVDEEAPVVSDVPAAISVPCDAVPEAEEDAVTVTDNCSAAEDIDVQVEDVRTPSGECPNSYTIIRTWTATDACGNVATATQKITVIDEEAPVISDVPEATTVPCDAVPEAKIEEVTVTDNCSDAANIDVQVNDVKTSSTTCLDSYVITRTWTATDECGNVSTKEQIITVEDNVAPVIDDASLTLVQDAYKAGDCAYEVFDLTQAVKVVSTDNCTPETELTITQDIAAGTPITETTLVEVTVTDRCGNSVSVQFTLKVPLAPTLAVDAALGAICEGESFDLANAVVLVENGTLEYYPQAGRSGGMIASEVMPVAPSTTYYVVVVNSESGCFVEKAVTIPTAQQPAIVSLDIISGLCGDEAVEVTTNPASGVSIAWTRVSTGEAIGDDSHTFSLIGRDELKGDKLSAIATIGSCVSAPVVITRDINFVQKPTFDVNDISICHTGEPIELEDIVEIINSDGDYDYKYYRDGNLTDENTIFEVAQNWPYWVEAISKEIPTCKSVLEKTFTIQSPTDLQIQDVNAICSNILEEGTGLEISAYSIETNPERYYFEYKYVSVTNEETDWAPCPSHDGSAIYNWLADNSIEIASLNEIQFRVSDGSEIAGCYNADSIRVAINQVVDQDDLEFLAKATRYGGTPNSREVVVRAKALNNNNMNVSALPAPTSSDAFSPGENITLEIANLPYGYSVEGWIVDGVEISGNQSKFYNKGSNKITAKISDDVCATESVFEVPVKWPTAITPYIQDGLNDLFLVGTEDINLLIFNRYGQKVFEGKGGWDGRHRGKFADPGTYYYVADLPNGTTEKGTVEIVKRR